MSAIGQLFRTERRAKGLSIADLARMAPAGKLNKNIRVLQAIERGEDIFPAKVMLDRFAPILGIGEEQILSAMCADFVELDSPVPPAVVVRLIPAVYCSLPLPEGCTTEQAAEIAREHSKTTGRKTSLVLSRIRARYFDQYGSSTEAYSVPWTSLGGLPGHLLPAEIRSRLALRLRSGIKDTKIEK